MNENRIQQVVEIEKRAQDIHEQAVREAAQLPIEAERDAQEILVKTRAQAHAEATQLIARAQADDEVAAILARAEERNRQVEAAAMNHFDRAVAHVLERILGGD